MDLTLHEFMLITKASEYLIAVISLIVFTGFWIFLFNGPKGKPDG